jgi:hypothetical protein
MHDRGRPSRPQRSPAGHGVAAVIICKNCTPSTGRTREAAEDLVLTVSSEYRFRPMTLVEQMRCDMPGEGLEDVRRAANRATSGLAAQR